MMTRRALNLVAMIATWATWWVALCTAQPSSSRLTREEIADPLAPWTLEASGQAPLGPRANPTDSPLVPSDAPTESEREAEAEQPLRGDEIPVVRCRQILIGHPEHARRLAALLRAGASLQDARRAIGGVDVVERQRDYAIEDLEPELRAEIEALPEGGWTRVHTWRGRAALVQVVARLQRSRSMLPVLGEGLSAEERERLSARFRLNAPPPPTPRPQNPEDTAIQVAAVIDQVKPETPENVLEGGEVVVFVEVGSEGEAVDVRVQTSTNPALEAAALDAARRSRYRAATRLGTPEPGSVTITFRFAAPGAPPEEDPGRHD